jgi:PhzF family phenazine biosynthesis protein
MSARRERAFVQVDVFADRPGAGNPVAVVLDGDGFDDAAMQAFANWTNLSETTFVLAPTAPGASYRVRIFTPRSELPFAGHPSVGTAHALLDAGRIAPVDGRLAQQCAAGVLPMRVEGEGATRSISVRAPRGEIIATDAASAALLAAALPADRLGAVEPTLLSNGPRWWCVEFVDEDAVRTLQPDLPAMGRLIVASAGVGVAVYARSADGRSLVMRGFCPADGIPEDPVTGSANAAIASLLHARGALGALGDAYVVSQGREVGRDGRIDVRIDAEGEVWIGGLSQTVVVGSLAW